MKKSFLFSLGLLLAIAATAQDKALSKKIEEWKDARFGLFIHWGPVSLKGTEIGWSRGREWTIEEYDNLYKQFNPVNFNAEEWVKLAKDAGMKYIVFTSKHHDGFCMWDTKYNDFNIMNTPFKRDVMKELSEACRKYGMALGFYHSTCDWHNPDFPWTSPGGSVKRETSNIDRYTEYLKNQSGEILKNYGPLLVMWYDVPQAFDSVRGQGVINYIRKIQPDVIVNNRTGARGDFDTPEQRVGNFQNKRPWETCMTIGQQWAWKPNDNVKTLEQCLHNLIRSAGGDGNLLFNVGPKPDGTIEALQAERLREMGKWLEKYGYSIYGTRGGPFKPADWGVSTRKGNKIYLHVLNLPGKSPLVNIPDIGIPVKQITCDNRKVKFKKADGIYRIQPEPSMMKPINTILEIEYESGVMDVKPLDIAPMSVSFKKNVKGSSNTSPGWINHQWVDLRAVNNGEWSGSFWQPGADDKEPWIEMDLGDAGKFSRVILYGGNDIPVPFTMKSKTDGEWKTVLNGKLAKGLNEIKIKPVTARYVRFEMNASETIPLVYEIILQND